MIKAELRNKSMPFEFELHRMRRKTLVIYVKAGKVEVRCPLRASSAWVNSFLLEKTPWILQQLAEQRSKLRERPVIADQREVLYLGKPRKIQVIISMRPRVLLRGSTLYMFVTAHNRHKLEELFHNWLRTQAQSYMTAQSEHFASILGVKRKLKGVIFRLTRSKWGHCCQDGTIQYNWLAMMAPKEVINYLIAHEVSHLRHLDHSASFWNTVASICPNYSELRLWLTQNGHRFWTR
jgi:predicted metal-dependent hydrolase